jgi:integrase
VLFNLYIFVRSSELRFARRDEIDFDNALWTIPSIRESLHGVRYSERGSKMMQCWADYLDANQLTHVTPYHFKNN